MKLLDFGFLKKKPFKIVCSLTLALGLFIMPAHAEQLISKKPTTYNGQPAYEEVFYESVVWKISGVSKLYYKFTLSQDERTTYSSSQYTDFQDYPDYHYEYIDGKPHASNYYYTEVVKAAYIDKDGNLIDVQDYTNSFKKLPGQYSITVNSGGSSNQQSQPSGGGSSNKSSGSNQSKQPTGGSSKTSGGSKSSGSSSNSATPSTQQQPQVEDKMSSGSYHLIARSANAKNITVKPTVTTDSKSGCVKIKLDFDSAGTDADQYYADVVTSIPGTDDYKGLPLYTDELYIFKPGTYYVHYNVENRKGTTYLDGYYGVVNVTQDMLKHDKPVVVKTSATTGVKPTVTAKAKTDYTLPIAIASGLVVAVVGIVIVVLKKKKHMKAEKQNNALNSQDTTDDKNLKM